MIAVDTNILVYAHREDSPWHEAANSRIAEIAEGQAAWAIPWPCLHEFLSIVTHARIYAPPTPLDLAVDQIAAWTEVPTLILLSETEGYWEGFRKIIESGQVTGGQVHDARIAALCIQHGISTLWTADRDFSRFPGLKAKNPLIS